MTYYNVGTGPMNKTVYNIPRNNTMLQKNSISKNERSIAQLNHSVLYKHFFLIHIFES